MRQNLCKTHQPDYVLIHSYGEKIIKDIVEENNLAYQTQKSYPDCRNNGRLYFDFFLPEFNLIIEYDGKQHFTPKHKWGGVNGFLTRRFHDEIKNNYCRKNQINLLRIPYTIRNKAEIQNIIIEVLYGISHNSKNCNHKFIHGELYDKLYESSRLIYAEKLADDIIQQSLSGIN